MDSSSATLTATTLDHVSLMDDVQAVIDIGSNSLLLLIARRLPGGGFEILDDRAIVTRLSEGAAESGRLKASAIDRTLVALHEFRTQAQEVGIVPRAYATEGLRMVENPEDFLAPAAEVLGAPVEIISGEREAELSYLSVANECDPGQQLRVIDIGGGSTELIVGTGRDIVSAKSHRVGSVRLTERFVHSDPIHRDEIEAMERIVRESFAHQPISHHRQLHGLAGTVTSAAALILGLTRYDRERVDRTRLSYEQVVELRNGLAKKSVAERREITILGRGRADVIVAGTTILLVAMEHCGAQELVVRDRGLRYALLDSGATAR